MRNWDPCSSKAMRWEIFGKNGVNQAYTVASNFTDAMLVMDDRQDQLIDVIVGATFDNLQDTKKVPAAGKAITGIQGCVAVDKMIHTWFSDSVSTRRACRRFTASQTEWRVSWRACWAM